MKTVVRNALILTATLVLLSCAEKKPTANSSADASKSQTQAATTTLRRVQYDFNGYSSQGGLVFAYFDGASLKYFEIYLLGERGKVTIRFDIEDTNRIAVTRTEYDYDKSIYEGDTTIVAQRETKGYLESGTEYWIKGGKATATSSTDTLSLYDEAMEVIKGKK